ncbi:BlaI/MecI/CopY family transcriptional regulator [Clostridium sp. ASF356]|nr:BlaI/MecI/CopY family transcriptional regulator [Clostridium sp. MD294]
MKILTHNIKYDSIIIPYKTICLMKGGKSMGDLIRVSDAEMKVMEKVWEKGEMITVSELISMLTKEEKEGIWIYQKVATFLTRLEKKGMVSKTKKDKLVYYYPLISREQYNEDAAKELVNTRFGGSLKGFLTAFSKNNMSKKEIEEVKEWINHFNHQ